MTFLEALIVPLKMDRSDFNTGVDEAKSKSNGLVSGLSAIGGGVVTAGIGVASAGIAGLTAFLFDSTKASSEAEDIQSQLNSVLKSTGGIAGVTADNVNNLATSLSKVTKFEDDSIVSGENLLLTFTNIGKDVFPATTEIMLDMSQAMKQDLSTSAIQLGKSLNNPKEGLTALTRVGVTFTDEQKALVESLQDSGDMAGAQTVILQELQKEFGGSAKAAGETASGAFEIFKNTLGNVKETIGGSLIPILSNLATTATNILNNPQTQAGIAAFTSGVVSFATSAITYIPIAINGFLGLVTFLQNNQGIVLGVLAALAVSVGAFVYTTIIPAAIATITAMAPIIGVMALVGAAVYLLYKLWDSNFLGIRDTVTDIWNNKLKPVFDVLVSWLQNNIPVALKILSDFWTNTLLPAIKINWDFLSTNVFPLFKAIASFLGAVFGVAITALAGLFQNVLLPALSSAWGFMNDKVFPIFKSIGDWISSRLSPAFSGLSTAIQGVTGWIQTMADAMANITLPSWLTPHSPFKLTWAFYGLKDSLKDVTKEVGNFSSELNISGVINPATKNIEGNTNKNELKQLIESLKANTGKQQLNEKKLARYITNSVLQGI